MHIQSIYLLCITLLYVVVAVIASNEADKQGIARNARRLMSRKKDNDETMLASESLGLFQGDIIATKQQIAERFGPDVADKAEAHGSLRKVNEEIADDERYGDRRLGLMTSYNRMWNVRDSKGRVVVPYVVHSSMPANIQQIVFQAMSDIEIKTGIVKFKPRATENDYVFFQHTGSGCWSYVGRIGGKQEINLQNGCQITAGIHEIYHALGFWHEHSRSDRDKYISINWDNIEQGKDFNFDLEITDSLGSSYDYSSIMHYTSTIFGKVQWQCNSTDIPSNTVSYIRFAGYGSEPLDFCITVKDGNTNLFDGQIVELKECGENNFMNQYWVIESFGDYGNIFRFVLDTSFCLSVDNQNQSGTLGNLVAKKCIEGAFTKQVFLFDQMAWNDVVLRWNDDDKLSLTRNQQITSSQSYELYLNTNGADDWYNQMFAIEFMTHITNRPITAINSFCSYGPLETIDGHGNKLGGTVLSNDDILQLQLLYKCPGGPRSIQNFCSSDCKCKENQGNCSSNDQCDDGLNCIYDGVSMKRCVIPPTSYPTQNPSDSPSKEPTRTPSTNSPTYPPTFPPTKNPTTSPTISPSKSPTSPTTGTPTSAPSTKIPTVTPSQNPSTTPTLDPTKKPSVAPTKTPTKSPSRKPTNNPSSTPSTAPSLSPTPPTKKPTKNPSRRPTMVPTILPTRKPTNTPSSAPTLLPTLSPTNSPILDCDHRTQKICRNHTNCMWAKVEKKNKCVPFDCSQMTKRSCRDEQERCKWVKAEKICKNM